MKKDKTIQQFVVVVIIVLASFLGYLLNGGDDSVPQDISSADLGRVVEQVEENDELETESDPDLENEAEDELENEIETIPNQSTEKAEPKQEPVPLVIPDPTPESKHEAEEIIEVEVEEEITEPEDEPEDDSEYYLVVEVVDGDTIDVNIDGEVERLRLIGIDTPESVHPSKPVECFALEASDKAKEWLMGEMVSLEGDPTQGERGKYGRLLRYVRTQGGLFYNLEIIKQGYAFEYTYSTPYQYQQEFKQAEKYARENELGLWEPEACRDYQVEIEEKDGEDVVVEVPADGEYVCSHNKYNCSHFSTQAQAQAVYEYCGGASNDVHRLDGSDKDGLVCEGLD